MVTWTMNDNERLKDIVSKDLDVRASDETHDRMRNIILAAHEHSQDTESARTLIWKRSILMKNPIAKLAVAAVIVGAVMLGMYIVTGSVDGTATTIAQVRAAMNETDWMRMRNKSGPEMAWYAFISKVQIAVGEDGEILYLDFNAGKRQVWKPGDDTIYETPIDETRQFAGGVSGPSGAIGSFFDTLEDDDWRVTQEPGDYDGRIVEVWTATRDATASIVKMYVDAVSKLPVALTEGTNGSDGSIQIQKEVVFDYPDNGPADIYEAGAPRSAEIRPAPED